MERVNHPCAGAWATMEDEWRFLMQSLVRVESRLCGGDGGQLLEGVAVENQAGSRGSSLDVSWEVETRGRMISMLYLGLKVTWWRNLEEKMGPV